MSLLWKLLRQHISIPQFAGFFFANLVGMVIILLGTQFYTDVQAIYESEDSFMKADYLIINKKIGAITMLTGKSVAFTEEELQEVGSQPFVESVGFFTPSAFNVRAAFEMEGLANMSTDMFFESVPDRFVDVASSQWHYEPGSTELPIILPKNYLDLYNFGYASSRGMPKLSEGIVGAVTLHITIRGNGESGDFNGRIVGFSGRLNTILVPESFMKWANSKYVAKSVEPTRLILKVSNPTDDRIAKFLSDKGYETDIAKLDASKTTYMLRVIVAIVMAVGLVISVLAFYILMLSIYLLVEKNSYKLENLLIIGYSPLRVSMPYQLLTIILNVLVLLMAFGILLLVRSIYLSVFAGFFPHVAHPSLLPSLIVGIAILLLVSIINICVVKNKVMSIWNRKD